MMQDLISIFKTVKSDFCSLWNFKQRGSTLEIITPMVTTSSKFVSVFLTVRNGEFIVSDGGWLSDESYGCIMDMEDEIFYKVFEYYKKYFDVLVVNNNQLDFYFKKTNKKEFIPNLVFDISNFISSVASNSQIQFLNQKEKDERAMFSKNANQFIRTFFEMYQDVTPVFNKPVSTKMSSVKFSAIVTIKNEITIINYITGSTPLNFTNSIGKANITFEVSNEFPEKAYIKNKIALINNNAAGYEKNRHTVYLNKLSSTTNNKNLLWGQKDKMKDLIAA